MTTTAVRFDVSREDAKLIAEIAERAIQLTRKALMKTNGRVESDMLRPQDWMMDITAVHANGCPLRLREMLLADDFNFTHDAFGIREHLDRTTGQLRDCFVPRFAKAERVRSGSPLGD